MTVIAFDGKTLASDSRSTDPGGIVTDYEPKIFFFKGIGWAGAAGDSEDCELFLDWVGHNFRKKYKPARLSRAFQGIYIPFGTPKRCIVYFRRLIPIKYQFPIAIGSGSAYALMAMRFGAGAADAVRATIPMDHCCGGAIQEFNTLAGRGGKRSESKNKGCKR